MDVKSLVETAPNWRRRPRNLVEQLRLSHKQRDGLEKRRRLFSECP
eukprot:SAG31_NODE_15514_length_751_cov_0.923313_1_plen_45_part_10